MYHRFNENKYPSTNIRNEVFIKHLEEIDKLEIEFIDFNKFKKIIKSNMDKSYLLLTVDDGFSSFYLNAWPYSKEEKKFHFVLFCQHKKILVIMDT